MMVTDDVGGKIIMLVTFSMLIISHQHLKVVTNIDRLQHPSPASMN